MAYGYTDLLRRAREGGMSEIVLAGCGYPGKDWFEE